MTHRPLVMSRDYFNHKSLHLPRNQREAGIDHLEWEERIKPMRPLTADIGVAAGAILSLFLLGATYF
jgi:hypothetical protein